MVTTVVTVSPLSDPVARTVAEPAAIAVARVLNCWKAFAPGATSAKDLLPYALSRAMVTAASWSLNACTPTYALPATHRTCTVVVSGSSFGSYTFFLWWLSPLPSGW